MATLLHAGSELVKGLLLRLLLELFQFLRLSCFVDQLSHSLLLLRCLENLRCLDHLLFLDFFEFLALGPATVHETCDGLVLLLELTLVLRNLLKHDIDATLVLLLVIDRILLLFRLLGDVDQVLFL